MILKGYLRMGNLYLNDIRNIRRDIFPTQDITYFTKTRIPSNTTIINTSTFNSDWMEI